MPRPRAAFSTEFGVGLEGCAATGTIHRAITSPDASGLPSSRILAAVSSLLADASRNGDAVLEPPGIAGIVGPWNDPS